VTLRNLNDLIDRLTNHKLSRFCSFLYLLRHGSEIKHTHGYDAALHIPRKHGLLCWIRGVVHAEGTGEGGDRKDRARKYEAGREEVESKDMMVMAW
jgi:hypothetical protein